MEQPKKTLDKKNAGIYHLSSSGTDENKVPPAPGLAQPPVATVHLLRGPWASGKGRLR